MPQLLATLFALFLLAMCPGCTAAPVSAQYDRCAGQYKYCPYGTVLVCMCAGLSCQLVCVKP
jgi:hypothetical protein